MQEKSVGELVEVWQEWKLVMLAVSMVLVVALLFAGGLLRPGGFGKAGLRDVGSFPSVIWLFAIFIVFLAMSSAPQLIGQIEWIGEQEYDETQLEAINTVGVYLFGIIAGLGMLFVLRRSAVIVSAGASQTGV